MSLKLALLKLIPHTVRAKIMKMVNHIAARNYWIDKHLYQAWLWRQSQQDRANEPILVYTMGKVGSTTVQRSLEAASDKYSIHHLHWLVPEQLRFDEKLTRSFERRHRGTPLERVIRPDYIWSGQFFSKRVKSLPKNGGKWKIITLIRDPVARNISSFFENLQLIFEYDLPTALRSKSETEILNELWELFNDGYVAGSNAFPMDCNPLTWFDDELKSVFNVDIFEKEFPASQGYEIYRSQRAEVLLIRLDDLDACANTAFDQFLGLKHFKIQHDNISSDKTYANIYRGFIDFIKLPDDYLDKMYNSRLSKYFYTDKELSAFKMCWKG